MQANQPDKTITERSEVLASINSYRQEPFPLSKENGAKAFDTPLLSTLLNIDAKSRSSLFPWRGQFSPQLVEALFRAYAAPGMTVLDSFMGSGTVLVEAARLNLQAWGYEINPAGYLLARVYELCNLPGAARQDLLERAEAALRRMYPNAFELPLFRSGQDHYYPNLAAWFRSIPHPQTQMLIEAFIILLGNELDNHSRYVEKWSTIRKIVMELPFSTYPVQALVGDARALTLPPDSVDFVLTSPPYINVFNYHHNSRAAIELLGWQPLVIARSEIGSNRKFRQNRFLTVIQYCIDMSLALAELHRVCKHDARILLIVGRESNVHKTAFMNSQIVSSLATNIVGLQLILKQERGYLNRFGQRIYEDILHFVPTSVCADSMAKIVEQARDFGTQILLETSEYTPSDRQHYLQDAIACADMVTASPILTAVQRPGGVP